MVDLKKPFERLRATVSTPKFEVCPKKTEPCPKLTDVIYEIK